MYVSQPYKRISLDSPLETFSPVSITDVKLWAKLSGSIEDALIQGIIDGVTLEVEKYTKREIALKAFQTFRNNFGDVNETPLRDPIYFPETPVTLRRTPLHSITSVSYLSDGVSVAMDLDDIDIVEGSDFSSFVPAAGKYWPIPDRRPQCVAIEFVAGYEKAASVPQDLKIALLAHITSVYHNRGDCDSGGGSCSCKFAPGQSLAVYNQYRIEDFRG